MFTGIVERRGRVTAIVERPGGRLLRLAPELASRLGGSLLPPWRPAQPGESISVSGVCLTVVEAREAGTAGQNGGGGGEPHEDLGGYRHGCEVAFEAVPETLSLTTLGDLRVGDLVNLERSLRLGDELGGHMVTGHVDGLGRVTARRPEGDQVLFEVEVPGPPATAGVSRAGEGVASGRGLIASVIHKGSVAVDGISLTVVAVDPERGRFRFAAIPHTLERTTVGDRKVGDRVNLETDVIGKWVLHSVQALGGAR